MAKIVKVGRFLSGKYRGQANKPIHKSVGVCSANN